MEARTRNELQTRVLRGATFLDEKRSGWRSEIDGERLSLTSEADCVLGQLYGGFRLGLDALGLSVPVSRALGLNYEARTNLGWLALYPGGAEMRATGIELEREEAATLREFWLAQLEES